MNIKEFVSFVDTEQSKITFSELDDIYQLLNAKNQTEQSKQKINCLLRNLNLKVDDCDIDATKQEINEKILPLVQETHSQLVLFIMLISDLQITQYIKEKKPKAASKSKKATKKAIDEKIDKTVEVEEVQEQIQTVVQEELIQQHDKEEIIQESQIQKIQEPEQQLDNMVMETTVVHAPALQKQDIDQINDIVKLQEFLHFYYDKTISLENQVQQQTINENKTDLSFLGTNSGNDEILYLDCVNKLKQNVAKTNTQFEFLKKVVMKWKNQVEESATQLQFDHIQEQIVQMFQNVLEKEKKKLHDQHDEKFGKQQEQQQFKQLVQVSLLEIVELLKTNKNYFNSLLNQDRLVNQLLQQIYCLVKLALK